MKAIYRVVAGLLPIMLANGVAAAIYTCRFDGTITDLTDVPFAVGDDFSLTVSRDSNQPFSQVPGFFTDAFAP